MARRSFLGKAGAGVAGIGVAHRVGSPLSAQSPAPEGGAWQPARHPEDEWLARIPGKHRHVYDTATPAGFGEALFFANNFYTGNRNGYGLTNADLAVVVCARHQSTPFAYTDAMWAKYGAPLAGRAGFTDPTTGQPPSVNVFGTPGYGAALTNSGVMLGALITNGLHFAVCQMATRAYAGVIARAVGAQADAIYDELANNLIENAHLVPAGVVAVSRAQELGYTFAFTG